MILFFEYPIQFFSFWIFWIEYIQKYSCHIRIGNFHFRISENIINMETFRIFDLKCPFSRPDIQNIWWSDPKLTYFMNFSFGKFQIFSFWISDPKNFELELDRIFPIWNFVSDWYLKWTPLPDTYLCASYRDVGLTHYLRDAQAGIFIFF